MTENLTITELEKRWDHVLSATQRAVNKNPGVYRLLKSLAGDIVENPLDIHEYMPTVGRLSDLLETLDPGGNGSIFSIFNERIKPASIWQVALLRVECGDLLAHLKEFDKWRCSSAGLRLVK
jgi:hypothetical protein